MNATNAWICCVCNWEAPNREALTTHTKGHFVPHHVIMSGAQYKQILSNLRAIQTNLDLLAKELNNIQQ